MCIEKEWEVLCDDGETVVLQAQTEDDAVQDAIERGYRAFKAECLSDWEDDIFAGHW